MPKPAKGTPLPLFCFQSRLKCPLLSGDPRPLPHLCLILQPAHSRSQSPASVFSLSHSTCHLLKDYITGLLPSSFIFGLPAKWELHWPRFGFVLLICVSSCCTGRHSTNIYREVCPHDIFNFHFLEAEIEAQNGCGTCPRPHG